MVEVLLNRFGGDCETDEVDGMPYLQKGSLRRHLLGSKHKPITTRRTSPHKRWILNLALLLRVEPADAVISLVDTDGQPGVARQLRAFRDDKDLEERIVLGVPHPEIEAWGLWCAGESPESVTSPAELRSLKKELGVDPLQSPDRLSSNKNSPKECKAVVIRLGVDLADAVAEASERRIRQGEKVGIAAFVSELESLARR